MPRSEEGLLRAGRGRRRRRRSDAAASEPPQPRRGARHGSAARGRPRCRREVSEGSPLGGAPLWVGRRGSAGAGRYCERTARGAPPALPRRSCADGARRGGAVGAHQRSTAAGVPQRPPRAGELRARRLQRSALSPHLSSLSPQRSALTRGAEMRPPRLRGKAFPVRRRCGAGRCPRPRRVAAPSRAVRRAALPQRLPALLFPPPLRSVRKRRADADVQRRAEPRAPGRTPRSEGRRAVPRSVGRTALQPSAPSPGGGAATWGARSGRAAAPRDGVPNGAGKRIKVTARRSDRHSLPCAGERRGAVCAPSPRAASAPRRVPHRAFPPQPSRPGAERRCCRGARSSAAVAARRCCAAALRSAPSGERRAAQSGAEV